VGGTGQRTNRADLNGIAGEVGLKRFVGADADLLLPTPLQHVDEVVARDLVAEPGAAHTCDTPLAVQQHLRRDVDRLGKQSFAVSKAALRPAGGEALSTVLLECTLAGLATCPVAHLTELSVSRELLAALTGHTDLPQVLIRVGVAPALDKVPPATPRRPLTDILRRKS